MCRATARVIVEESRAAVSSGGVGSTTSAYDARRMYAMALPTWTSKQLTRVELPTPEPGRNEVRVAVHAIGVNPVDWKMRSGGPLRLAARVIRLARGPRGPIILGVDFAGVIEAVGANVRDLE